MKNKEIEELLNELKDVTERHTIEIREYGVVETIPSSISKELRLNSYSANLLLSYIETLENRNKELYEGFMATQEELTDYATENERLENNRDKAIECIEKQKKKMYKSRNKIALFILMKLENILKGDSDEQNN